MITGIYKGITFILIAVMLVVGIASVFNIAQAASPTNEQLISYIQSRVPGFDPSGRDKEHLMGIARGELKDQGFNNNEINAMLTGNLPLPGSSDGGGSDGDGDGDGDGGSGGDGGTLEFVPLETIPGVIDADTAKEPSKFFNAMFNFGIIIAGFLAVIMIAYGGIRYMSTDAIQGKKEGKEIITAALMGLLLILFSWILLKTINPDILKFNLF